ncbi:rRNA maturation RNase YbeY [candidate division KSB1 bacterium]|nr:rRNA maturation RNase YbeY [candidate division KSB1 bacterium]
MAKRKALKLEINIDNINDNFKVDTDNIEHLVNYVLNKENYKFGDIGIVFVNHNYIIELNKKFLGKNETTDVLSFSLDETSKPEISGEVYINLDIVSENAIEFNVSFVEEVNRMVIHGLLHLAGYDDQTDSDKAIMTRREDLYLEDYEKDLQ